MHNKKLRDTFIASGLTLVGCYSFIFYSYKYGYFYEYLPAIFVIAPFMWLVIIWTNLNEKSRWKIMINAIGTVFLLFLIFYGLLTLQDKYFTYQLNQFGTTTYAKVIAETQERVKSSTYYHVIIRYQCDKIEYLQKLSNNNHFYRYGDSVRIVCSTRNPDILKVTGYIPGHYTGY